MLTRTVFLLAAGLLLAQTAHAQIQVQAKTNRKLYVQGEPIYMILGMRNLTGREITLDGRSNSEENWLSFSVTTRDEGYVPARQHGIEIDPVTLGPGEVLRRKVQINPFFVLDGVGDFRAKAIVYFAPLDNYIYTSSSFFTITPGKSIWKKTVGAPDGSGETGYRTYELVTLTDIEDMRLYVRVSDPVSGNVRQCFLLDKLVNTANPQATVDDQNMLHVLFMSRPQVMRYVHLGLDGSVVREETFRTNTTYPRMLQMADGSIRISGGTLMPSRESLEALREAAGPPPLVSDRPGI